MERQGRGERHSGTKYIVGSENAADEKVVEHHTAIPGNGPTTQNGHREFSPGEQPRMEKEGPEGGMV